jgi:hypothetical protein
MTTTISEFERSKAAAARAADNSRRAAQYACTIAEVGCAWHNTIWGRLEHDSQ